ncbi:hypothetical protein FVER53590_08582 [Fusarium verticillioides]|nr:hypothetical protein FVER53590_08582 [Fusarium verticillioides]
MAASDYASESRGAVAIAVMATLSSISLIVVSLRVYARAIMLRNFGVDDACAILACLLTIADACIIATNVRNGLGSHISTLSGEQISNFLRMFYFSAVVYNVTLAVIKTVFLLQYYRAIPVRQYKKTYIASVVLVTCWSLSQIFLNTFMCWPIASFWDVTIKGTCILNKSSFYVSAAGNILTDILIMVLPIPVLRSLKLGRRQKWILMSVFCLGIFCKLETLNFLEDNVDYETLSYAWGSSEDKATIIVNEATLQITQNLRDALSYLRHDSKPRSIWIDAICINQSDVDERSSQVRLMGRIYSSASCVISWLGLEEDPIDYVELLKKARSLIELVKTCSTDELFALLLDSPSKEDLEEVFENGFYSPQLVIEGCTLTEKESVSAFKQILMGLIQLKRKRTQETFQIILADFGIAGKYTEQSEYFYGTAYYKAPEIFDETADVVDDRSDVWSTGIIVLEKMYRIDIKKKRHPKPKSDSEREEWYAKWQKEVRRKVGSIKSMPWDWLANQALEDACVSYALMEVLGEMG